MKIIVLIKQVPNTTDVKIDPKTGNLIREGLDSIINPDDRHGLEAAISLKETQEAEVTVVSMGPPQAMDAITEALGMGADKGVLLTDRAFAGADTWATSHTLARAIQAIGTFDLIVCGRQAIDGDTAQIGPQVAEALDIAQVTQVFEIESVSRDSLVVKRRVENGYERIQCALPALITVTTELNTPRYPDMVRLIAACQPKAAIRVWNAADIGVRTMEVGLEGSLTHVIRTFSPKHHRQGELLTGSVRESVHQLLSRLRQSEGATACKAFQDHCRLPQPLGLDDRVVK